MKTFLVLFGVALVGLVGLVVSRRKSDKGGMFCAGVLFVMGLLSCFVTPMQNGETYKIVDGKPLAVQP